MRKGTGIAIIGTINWFVLITEIITILVYSNNIINETISVRLQTFIIVLFVSTFICFVMSFVVSVLAIILFRKKSIEKSYFKFLMVLNVSYLLVFISLLIYYLNVAFHALMGI